MSGERSLSADDPGESRGDGQPRPGGEKPVEPGDRPALLDPPTRRDTVNDQPAVNRGIRAPGGYDESIDRRRADRDAAATTNPRGD
ncbi:hypothetical protein FW784_12035 [Lysobacter lacus]|uniref:Uncharacterized protein n=1 Tax=Cognatilysobacter lacus TaxID=1643323 RepID=A0A5D8Z1Y9_9GAMM|nr:hypothetical protein FW784_12035 [Lysobacter lacus]